MTKGHGNYFLTIYLILTCFSADLLFGGGQKVYKGEIIIHSHKKNGSPYKEYTATAFLNTPIDSLIALVTDTASYTKWLHYCKEMKLIKRVSDTEGILYLIYNALIFSDRYAVVHFSFLENPGTKSNTFMLEKVKGSIPGIKNFDLEKKGLTLIKKIRISLSLIPCGDGYTKVVFQLYIDPGNGISPLLFNFYMKRMIKKTLSKMRKIVMLPKYQKRE